MKRTMTAVCVLAALALLVPNILLSEDGREGGPSKEVKQGKDAVPQIQLTILLDTSSSMQGLINQARKQLWKIVNELATAKQNGQVPELQVALYEYGKNSIPKEKGYLRQIVPLSDDLDKLSGELFALTTNGGNEYCGQVIAAATKELQGSKSDAALKLIFIAGNEPFSQGSVNYKEACAAAIAKGITVNTIFCGPESAGIQTGWQDGAHLADGSFMSINQNQQVATIKTPYDQKLAQLSAEVNRTYLFLGRETVRKENKAKQLAADKAAAGAAPAAAAERARFKASGLYRTGGDLLDGLKSGTIKLETLKEGKLPKELRGKSLNEKKTLVKKLTVDRAKIQNDIQKLSEQRKRYIADQQKPQKNAKGDETLDAAIIKAIRDQASRKKFEFEMKN